MTCFWNNLHQVHSTSTDWKTYNSTVFWSKTTKGLKQDSQTLLRLTMPHKVFGSKKFKAFKQDSQTLLSYTFLGEINIDYYIAFFISYPLSSRGHEMIYERGLIKGMI